MKFFDTNGREHKIDIRPSKWKRKAAGEGRGKFQSEVGDIIQDMYPGDHVLEEFPCVGERLFLDFFLPRKMLAIEIQGRQHHEYVDFFHGTKAGFKAQQARDSRKEEWCRINNIRLIKIDTGASEEKIKKALA